MKPKSDEQTPITFPGLDPETRTAFFRWCEVEQDRMRTERRRMDGEEAGRAQAWEQGAPERILQMANAEADALKIQGRDRLDEHRVDLEIRKLRIEGDRLEAEAMVGVATKALDLLWPKLESIGAGIAAEGRADRELIREEMRLIAGRNPVDGTRQ